MNKHPRGRQPQTHKLNVVTISRHDPACCSKRCGHFDPMAKDDYVSRCLLWGQLVSWRILPGVSEPKSAPERCDGCLEDKSLTVQVETAP